jgi:hypothetical protein
MQASKYTRHVLVIFTTFSLAPVIGDFARNSDNLEYQRTELSELEDLLDSLSLETPVLLPFGVGVFPFLLH